MLSKTRVGGGSASNDLHELIANLRPRRQEGAYVFCTLPGAAYGARPELAPFAAVAEPEGLTLVIERERADEAGLAYEGLFALISLRVFSSLQAVGLTAAVASRLAELGIAANVLAGFFHDHVLVPLDRAEEAMEALEAMAAG